MNEMRILNQLFAAQSMLSVFLDARKMGEFVAEALHSIPGVTACCLVIRDQAELIGKPLPFAKIILPRLAHLSSEQDYFSIPLPFELHVETFALQTAQRQFGYVFIKLISEEQFTPFRPAVRNFFNVVAVHLENTWQTELLRKYQEHLERLVEERTVELNEEIDQRKKTQEELLRSEQHYHDLVETAQDLIWQCDAQGRYIFLNHAWEAVLGYRLEEILGRKFTDFQTREQAEKDIVEYRRLMTGSSVSQYETSYLTKEGQEVYLIFNAKFYKDDDGKILGTRGSAYDISARKKAEAGLIEARAVLAQRVSERTADLQAANLALEKSNRLKDEFLASMSHELRTPLTGILGLSEALQLQTFGILSEKQLAAVQNIENSGRLLLEIINNILDFSMLEAGKLQLQLVPCVLADFCQNGMQMVEKQAQQKHLRASFSIEPASIIVRADVRRLKQILLHLLRNAVKFTMDGGSFGIQIFGRQPEHQVQICVWDTGIGIKPEDLPRLFQPFIQLDARLARQYNGIGLGLALVERLANLHGGSLSVESTFGVGSRFIINLPWEG